MTAGVIRRRLTSLLAAVGVLAGVPAVLVLSVATPAQAAEYYPVPASGIYTLDGHGYGHGHGLSQYGSQGAASSGLGAAQILAFYYPGTTQTAIGNPTVRVQLTASSSGDLRVDSTAGLAMTVRDQSSGGSATLPAGAFRVVTAGSTQTVLRYNGAGWDQVVLGGQSSFAGPIRFATSDGVSVFAPNGSARNYRGQVDVVRTTGSQSVAVSIVSMEDYLRGVVPRESPAWFAPAALQAQSVAARSYAWWDVQTPSAASWDICDTTACQVYGGRQLYTPSAGWQNLEYASTDNAVTSTAGIALYYAGQPAFTQFSSSNGGVASAGSQPYLASFNDPYDGIPAQNSNHDWTATLTAEYLQSMYPQIGTLNGIRIVSREGRGDWGGYITSLQLVGSTATMTVNPRLNLKSTFWKPRDLGTPTGDINAVSPVSGTQVQVTGWALDPNSADPIQVHVYVDGRGAGAYPANVSRPDVGAAYPGYGNLHGFDIVVPIGLGSHQVCVYAINVGAGDGNVRLGCRTADGGGLPAGQIDDVQVVDGAAVVRGWALDPDTTAPIDVHGYVNGSWGGSSTASQARPDVAQAYPAYGAAHGFSLSMALVPGVNQVCVFGINTPAGTNPSLGCRSVELKVDPFGDFRAFEGETSARVSGWAVDPDTRNPIDVHIYADGVYVAATTASLARPDVQAAVPGAGPASGYFFDVPLSPGAHDVCVYAINVARGTANPTLGCRTVLIGVAPQGSLDSVVATGALVQVRGWAWDSDTAASIDTHVYLDGRFVASVAADAQRPDVAAARPGSGPARGVDTSFTASPGQHTVCLYAINVAGGGTNPLLGCRGVTVALSVVPAGSLDRVDPMTGYVIARGWTYDPDVPRTPIRVHFYVDGRFAGELTAAEDRPDVAASVNGAGGNHGYTAYLGTGSGRHSVCAYAIDNVAAGVNPLLRCAVVDVS